MCSSGLRLAAALALAALAALAGCRTLPTPPAGAPWEARRAQLQARAHFELRGRVAVATGSEGFNASLQWIQDGARSQLTLAGPLGAGGAQVTATNGDLELTTSRGEQLTRDAARAQLAARLGFDPPLASLRYWVQGVPDPNAPASETLDDSQQRLSALVQSGWRIDYNDYASAGGQVLPARVTLQRDAVRVRLLVDTWQP
jgi:outer membrane lipoprotein LolB